MASINDLPSFVLSAASSCEYTEHTGYIRGIDTTLMNDTLSVKKFTPETIEVIRKALEYDEVIIKCQSCGQWAAKKTECKHCGSPVG